MVALSEALHYELAARRARVGVSVLCPGPVRSGIWRSERVRPAELANTRAPRGPDERAFLEGMGASIESGAEPDAVAPLVFESVRAGRFWILPDPAFFPAIRQRMQSIVDGVNPGEAGARG